MITLDDVTKIDDRWYDTRVEIFPVRAYWCRRHWRIHRWYGEILMRPSTFPGGGESSVWTYYYTYDVFTWTLRQAWFRGGKQLLRLEVDIENGRETVPTNG